MERARGGLSVAQVVFEPGQFEGFWASLDDTVHGKAWKQSLAAADVALLASPGSWEATHFHSTKMDPYPDWHDESKVVATVGGHVFLRLW